MVRHYLYMKQGFSRNKLKYTVNEQFFNSWTPQMAYVLGFTFADGNIYKTSLSWDVQIKDLNILRKINKALTSTYRIRLQRGSSYRLRLNNQILIGGAIKVGLLPKKNIRNTLPKIPKDLIKHFIRGYLDGDGWIVLRKRLGNNYETDIGFASGNRGFLEDLNNIISQELRINRSRVRKKVKITRRGVRAITYMLEFYSSTAYKISQWLFEDLAASDLYLTRKYQNYLKIKKVYSYLQSGTKVVRIIQKKLGKTLKELLEDLYIKQKLDGVATARALGVHSSSVYRWLARTGIKYPVRRISYG